MKKLISTLLATAIVSSTISLSTLKAQENPEITPLFPININAKDMPDEALRQVAWFADTNNDDILSENEAIWLDLLFLDDTKIVNFKEMSKLFPNIETITAARSNIQSLDGIYDFKNLKKVHIDKSVFKKLDINKFESLEVIDMSHAKDIFFPEGGKISLKTLNSRWDTTMITSLGSEYGYMDVENGIVTSFTPDKKDSLYYMTKNWRTVEVILTTSAMKRPSNVIAKQKTYNKINLSWEGGENALYYEVYRKAENGNTFKKIVTTKDKTFNVSVTPGKNYQFKVRGYRYVNGVKITTGFTSSIKGKATVSQVEGLKYSKKSNNEYKLSWKSTDGAKKYQIYRANKKDGTYKRILSTKETSVNVKYNKDNRFYKVRAYRTTGGENLYGKFSAVVELPKK